MGTQNNTEDVLSKSVCKVDGILNQIPLTSDKFDNFEAITPVISWLDHQDPKFFEETHNKVWKLSEEAQGSSNKC